MDSLFVQWKRQSEETSDNMQIAYRSDIGKKRTVNQDYVSWFKNKNNQPLMIVCDGMGGHKAGDVASEMAVSHLGQAWKQTSFQDIDRLSSWLLDSIQKINSLIFQKSLDFIDLDGMGTTLVAAAFVKEEVLIANVGDSRAYLFREDQLKQLTEDHSLVNEFVKSGEISLEDAQHHPQKNIVTRSVGSRKMVQVDLVAFPARPKDILILCTDGLTNMISEKEIKQILKQSSPLEKKTDQLIELSNDAGGSDNITVLITEFVEKKEGGTW